jgi:tetratricopeptide (TPR) repeat protein
MSPFCAPWHPDLGSFGAWWPVLAAAALLAVFVCKYKGWWRPLFFVFVCYLVVLSPALGFVRMLFQQETPCADWWQYLAAPCIFALIGAGCATVLALVHGGTRTGIMAVICAAMALLFVQTWRRCEIYASMETYCRAVIAENPHAWSMQNNLGVVLKKRGDFAEAVVHYRQALEDNPRFMEAHNNLGNALGLMGDFVGAEKEFAAALALQPNADIMASLATVYLADGKTHDAFATQAAAVKADRLNPVRYEEFGRMLAAQGHYDKAVDCYKNALILSPGDARVEAELAKAVKALKAK